MDKGAKGTGTWLALVRILLERLPYELVIAILQSLPYHQIASSLVKALVAQLHLSLENGFLQSLHERQEFLRLAKLDASGASREDIDSIREICNRRPRPNHSISRLEKVLRVSLVARINSGYWVERKDLQVLSKHPEISSQVTKLAVSMNAEAPARSCDQEMALFQDISSRCTALRVLVLRFIGADSSPYFRGCSQTLEKLGKLTVLDKVQVLWPGDGDLVPLENFCSEFCSRELYPKLDLSFWSHQSLYVENHCPCIREILTALAMSCPTTGEGAKAIVRLCRKCPKLDNWTMPKQGAQFFEKLPIEVSGLSFLADGNNLVKCTLSATGAGDGATVIAGFNDLRYLQKRVAQSVERLVLTLTEEDCYEYVLQHFKHLSGDFCSLRELLILWKKSEFPFGREDDFKSVWQSPNQPAISLATVK